MRRWGFAVAVFLFAFIVRLPASCAADISVATNFAGGSAEVLEIDQRERVVRLRPTKHTDRGWVCWWFCRFDGLTPGESLRLEVGPAPWATPDRAAVSSDGRTWRQSTPGLRRDGRITYQLETTGQSVWVAWGPPFVLRDAQQLVNETGRLAFAEPFSLCQTRSGNPTPAVVVHEPGTRSESDPANRDPAQDQTERDLERTFGVWIQARQHAWESGSSWVAKGFLDWLGSNDERAARLRRKAVVTVVPIMDVDNVERGAGGKNQRPQDHNRDWSSKPHWRAVAAAQDAIRMQNAAGRFDVFVDLHNPGAAERRPYFYIPPRSELSTLGRRNLARFLDTAQAHMNGPLPFTGKAIESGPRYDPKGWRAISKNWVAMNCRDHILSVTLETAWNTPHSTASGYQRVGRELGLAIEAYLREK